MGTVKLDGEVKTITTGRKLDAEGNPKLVARVLIEFVPTEKGPNSGETDDQLKLIGA